MDDDLSINDVKTSVPIVAEINIFENLVTEVVNPIDIEFTPKLNMQFDIEDESYDFYNAYGGKVGFSIRKDYANKSRKTGNITISKFVYSKQGFRVKDKRDIHTRKPRAETRTGCGALMQITYDCKKGKYVVYNFVESHNHPMIIEECTHMMPSQRRISVAQAIEVELACQFGVLLGNLDSDEMITNIFWADSRMIIDYGHFGDIVTFDTTYKLVQSNRPFAAFLGLNHHRKTAVFGLALMYDETANSFARLFDSFLNAMSVMTYDKIAYSLTCLFDIFLNVTLGKAPQTILTDQDGAMLSESLNSCLKEYLTRKMSIPDLFMHLDTLLSDKRYKEYQAEYSLLSKLPRLKQNCPILKQVGNMYTLKIFELFEDQFIEACVVVTVEGTSLDENGLRVSRVSVYDGSMDWTVTRWDDGFLSCSCGKYAMEGILCSHVLKVLKDDTHYFKELPSMYILKRWTIKARDNNVQDIRGCEVIADPKLEVRRRYRMLCRFFTEISSFASEKEKKSNGNNSVGAGVGGSGTVPPITYVRLNGCDIPSDAIWIYEDHHPCARLHSETNIDQMTYCPTTNFSHPRTPPTEQGTPFVSYLECRFSDYLDVDHTSGDRNLMPMSEETTSEINPPARQNLF
ncbi:protein FAR-RED ELONGATED HYPOCOTYL 3-like [Cornus florida]|uniref:protein FAR-RED ELONGATED HYPOCOTYL 3-like n=1 Tax=Cornus florida TaxID=4283 RepID=UPI002899BAD4|nr:protein FAR-RED ELONGATED HYPOCOTYL 3-like [Cornus florida]